MGKGESFFFFFYFIDYSCTTLYVKLRESSKFFFFLQGFVTTFKSEDLPTLKNLLSQTPDNIIQAGLHPTADQIELFAYHLPKTPLSNLMVTEYNFTVF